MSVFILTVLIETVTVKCKVKILYVFTEVCCWKQTWILLPDFRVLNLEMNQCMTESRRRAVRQATTPTSQCIRLA